MVRDVSQTPRIRIALADQRQRRSIYRMRHEVYARELAQHPSNRHSLLRDDLDQFNTYITVTVGSRVLGFVSITPPGRGQYSIDKYLPRRKLPFALDDRVYEVRLLTVDADHRRGPVACVLMYAAFRWIEANGGQRIMAIGRREVVELYRKVGMHPRGLEVQSGNVHFEVMDATVDDVREHLQHFAPHLKRLADRVDWQLKVPFEPADACFHGGAFFDAVGDEFDRLDRADRVINADVLDAWFDPSPKVLTALHGHLPWLVRTSPPTGCEGMVRTIERVRGVDEASVLPGAGSSDLIFLALRQWLGATSRVLILDPMYGEYAHVLEEVIGCQVDRLTLSRDNGYQVDPDRLAAAVKSGYDLIVMVNPNSPTGRHVPAAMLRPILRDAPQQTRIWIDETYVEYAGADQSLEGFAAESRNVIVCKSMSKVYALSGIRAAYLVGPAQIVGELRPLTPPWAVSLPAQLAAVEALKDQAYYTEQYRRTHALRGELVDALLAAVPDIVVVPSVANFILCHLPPSGPDAATVVQRCREDDVFLRDASGMGTQLGSHALRIAVKDTTANRRIVQVVARALGRATTDCQTPVSRERADAFGAA